MSHIKVVRGLDIPMKGKPSGSLRSLPKPKCIALNLNAFGEIKFGRIARTGDRVKLGQPLLFDKSCPERMFVAPAAGELKEVRRGYKRRLTDMVIELDEKEEALDIGGLHVGQASREEILKKLLAGGAFAQIRMRPCNLLARPSDDPAAIFVKAVESAPMTPSAELQVEKHERAFEVGLLALEKLTSGKVHLVYRKDTECKAFTEARGVEHHTVEGPHPVGNVSVHIHHIAPIEDPQQMVWTLSAYDVVSVGYLLLEGKVFVDKVLSVAGTGILPDHRGYYQGRVGYPISGLMDGRNESGPLRYLSGDVLTGEQVEGQDFLGFYHSAFTVIPESTDREFLHFFRLGLNKFSATRTYLSGLLERDSKEYDFSTNLHGEERAFVDGAIYDQVMPMQIPVMHLVKALMAQDYELAEQLGLMEVDSEDFALPTFICPSKIEMSEIVKESLQEYAQEIFH